MKSKSGNSLHRSSSCRIDTAWLFPPRRINTLPFSLCSIMLVVRLNQEDVRRIEVTETNVIITEHLYNNMLVTVDPLKESSDYGFDIFLKVKQFLSGI